MIKLSIFTYDLQTLLHIYTEAITHTLIYTQYTHKTVYSKCKNGVISIFISTGVEDFLCVFFFYLQWMYDPYQTSQKYLFKQRTSVANLNNINVTISLSLCDRQGGNYGSSEWPILSADIIEYSKLDSMFWCVISLWQWFTHLKGGGNLN